jgi:dolichol-phosphate mannosyltransferase
MISVVIPAYNEEGNLPVLYERLVSVTSNVTQQDFEFVFVDDCSTDQTANILNALYQKDKRVHVVRFARNCGSHAAISAGLNFCTGEAAIKMAADLQDPPELIPRLIEQWQKGYKVVWGKRKERIGERYITLAFSRAFYFLMNRLTNVKQPSSGADVTLVDRTVIEALKQCNEKNASNNMLIAWLGFSQTYIEYTKEARYSGSSKWTFSNRLKLFIDSIISFSYVPLRLMSLTGILFSITGLLISLRLFYNALFKGAPVTGWPSLMITILIIGGFQMIMLGMLGEYLWRTYDETRGRPKYVIEKNTLSKSISNRNEKKKKKDQKHSNKHTR